MLSPRFQRALGKIYLLLALGAHVLLVELIGKDLLFLAASRALTGERLEVFEIIESRAMLGRGHGAPPFLFNVA
jgi:hypothetical protein